jgi:hypothetical protein
LSSLFLVNMWWMSLPWLTCWCSLGGLYTLSNFKAKQVQNPSRNRVLRHPHLGSNCNRFLHP